jgi:hypothetical protein
MRLSLQSKAIFVVASIVFLLLIVATTLTLVTRQQDNRQKAATGPTTATIRSDGMLQVNGQAIFPIGWYHVSWHNNRQGTLLNNDLIKIADAGYNMMHPTITELQNTALYRQTAAERNVYTIGEYCATCPPDLGTLAGTLKNDPTMIGYGTGDDFNFPPGKSVTDYANKRNLIKQNAPGHLAYGSGSGHPLYNLVNYKDVFDIIGIQAYPIANWDQSYGSEMEESIQYYTRARRELPGKAVWAVPQAFMWPDFAGKRFPTAQELRNMVYGGLVARMNGIMIYTYWSWENGIVPASLWDEAALLGPDLKKLSPMLIDGKFTQIDPLPVTSKQVRVRGGVWEYQGKALVIIHNTSKSSVNASLTLPTSIIADAPRIYFPNDTRYGTGMVFQNNNTLTGSIAPYGIHVYELDSTYGVTLSPTPIPPSTTPLPTTPSPTMTPTKTPTPTPLPTTPPVGGFNLLRNPGFEEDTTGWNDVYNARVVTTNTRSGTKAIEVGPGEGHIYQTIPVTPGHTYTIQGYGKMSVAGQEGLIGVHILGSSGLVIRDFNAQPSITTTTYTKATLTVTMPTMATAMRIYAYNQSTSAKLYADDFGFVNDSATPTPTRTPSATPTPPPSATPIPPTTALRRGDANRDGLVDLIDFNIWRNEFSGLSSAKSADFNADNVVDLLDFNIWRTEFLAQ